MTTSLIELVAGLSAGPSRHVLEFGTPIHVNAGGVLFRLGDLADRVFVIERGRIALTMPIRVREREEAVLVEERQAGETVGWSALIPPHRFTLTATAPLDTDVLAIERGALVEYLDSQPEIGYLVMRNLAEIMGRRLQVFQAMWVREMQHGIERRTQPASGAA